MGDWARESGAGLGQRSLGGARGRRRRRGAARNVLVRDELGLLAHLSVISPRRSLPLTLRVESPFLLLPQSLQARKFVASHAVDGQPLLSRLALLQENPLPLREPQEPLLFRVMHGGGVPFAIPTALLEVVLVLVGADAQAKRQVRQSKTARVADQAVVDHIQVHQDGLEEGKGR